MATHISEQLPDISEQLPDSDDATPDMIVLDIGKHDAKDVKKLCKGKGRLLRKVGEAVEQLRGAGQVKPDAQVVLVVVRKDGGLFDFDDD